LEGDVSSYWFIFEKTENKTNIIANGELPNPAKTV
jgi:hypothetical protein